VLSKKAQREHEAIVALFGSAPGQDLSGAKETLWGAVNPVTYYAPTMYARELPETSWIAPGSVLVTRWKKPGRRQTYWFPSRNKKFQQYTQGLICRSRPEAPLRADVQWLWLKRWLRSCLSEHLGGRAGGCGQGVQWKLRLLGRGEESGNATLPYRPLPFLAGIGAQIRPKQVIPATRNLLMGSNFPVTLEKLGPRKINSPSRHQQESQKISG